MPIALLWGIVLHTIGIAMVGCKRNDAPCCSYNDPCQWRCTGQQHLQPHLLGVRTGSIDATGSPILFSCRTAAAGVPKPLDINNNGCGTYWLFFVRDEISTYVSARWSKRDVMVALLQCTSNKIVVVYTVHRVVRESG